MNLFKQQSQENEQIAKQAYVCVAQKVIGKYVIAHKMLNEALLAGKTVHNKKEPCLLCKIDIITKKMTKLEAQVGQLTKTYSLAFGSDLDIEAITEEACEKFYPGTTSKKSNQDKSPAQDIFFKMDEEGKDIAPSNDIPDDIAEMIEMIKNKLSGNGRSNVEVKVVDLGKASRHSRLFGKGGVFGIDPGDFDNFEDFYRAVKKAAKETKTNPEGVPGEEIIKEAIIHTAEEAASAKSVSEPKKSPKNSSNGEEAPSKN